MVTAFNKGKSEGELKPPDSFTTMATALKAGHQGIKGHHTLNHREGRWHSRRHAMLESCKSEGSATCGGNLTSEHKMRMYVCVWEHFQIS